jgi:hypothetical protein
VQHAPINDAAHYRLDQLGVGYAPEVVREVDAKVLEVPESPRGAGAPDQTGLGLMTGEWDSRRARNRTIARDFRPAALSRKWRESGSFVAPIAPGALPLVASWRTRARQDARIRSTGRTDWTPVGVEPNRRSPLSRGEPPWTLSLGIVAGDLRR